MPTSIKISQPCKVEQGLLRVEADIGLGIFALVFNSYVLCNSISIILLESLSSQRSACFCASSLLPVMRSSLSATMLNTSLRRVTRHGPNSPLPSRPSTPTPIAASFSSRTHQRRHSSSKRPVPPSNNESSISAAQVKAVGTKSKSEAQTKPIPESSAANDAEASGTIDVTKKRLGTESRPSHRKELRSKKDYSNEWLINVPSVAPTNHLKREGTHYILLHQAMKTNKTSQMSMQHPSILSTAL